ALRRFREWCAANSLLVVAEAPSELAGSDGKHEIFVHLVESPRWSPASSPAPALRRRSSSGPRGWSPGTASKPWGRRASHPESAITSRLAKTDLLMTLGGDGTFLAGARLAAPRGIPLLGVNLGRLGFLTELEEDQLETGVAGFLEGKHRIEERTILQVELLRG